MDLSSLIFCHAIVTFYGLCLNDIVRYLTIWVVCLTYTQKYFVFIAISEFFNLLFVRGISFRNFLMIRSLILGDSQSNIATFWEFLLFLGVKNLIKKLVQYLATWIF